jgi:peptidoglycan/LPS O-acetylase OafA/YrhL
MRPERVPSEPGLPTTEVAARGAVARAYFPELESLRGWAIVMVVLYHLDAAIRRRLRADALPTLGFVRGGHAGVGLFFVLSGFLLSLPFLTQAAGGRRVDLRRYVMRRALRILPLYYAAVIAGAVFVFGARPAMLQAVPYLLFLNGFSATVAPNVYPFGGVWWSLATEVQFYMLLPLLPAVLSSRRSRVIGLVLLALYAVVWAAQARHPFPVRLTLGRSLFGRGPLFLCGIAAAAIYLRAGARWSERLARSSRLRRAVADIVVVAIVIALERLLHGFPANRDFAWELLPAWHLVEGPLWATLLLVLVVAPLLTKRVLCNGVLTHLGLVSYSLYLIHPPLIEFGVVAVNTRYPALLESRATALGVEGTLFALCVALASVTYALVERPILVRKERLR